MANGCSKRAISVPKPFSSGDAAEWFLRFDICSAANDWKVKAVKLPTLLEGEALVDQLLLHQFVAGLPMQVSKQLLADGATTELKSTVQRTKLLMSLDEQQPVASHNTDGPQLGNTSRWNHESEKFDRLTEQVITTAGGAIQHVSNCFQTQ